MKVQFRGYKLSRVALSQRFRGYKLSRARNRESLYMDIYWILLVSTYCALDILPQLSGDFDPLADPELKKTC